MTGGRGTPSYAAPELWTPNFLVTHKCDVYSFGILLFEIVGRRRNLGVQLVESQEWFPMCIWKRFDVGEFQKLIIACGIKEKNREITERMVGVALSFVQYRSNSRPIMSDEVKMLEGSVEMSKTLNPFQPFMDGNFTSHPVQVPLTYTTDTNGFSDVFNESKIRYPTLFSSNPNPIIADQSNPTPLTVLPTILASSVVSQPYPYPLLLYNNNNLLIIPHLNLAFLLLPQLVLFHSCSPLHLYTYTPSDPVIPTSQNLPPDPPSPIPEPL
ncbi:LEAF RUST 10 DISEASE-RESISTANCE LOCUS RECEPTOR-LIKE PROTEIN KINASE-like 2.2 [Glycine soja]|uniref:LEAF RUST 10 DISEASE-RESISTANCE LOCUS RECEPTOR-LIKE PROTEIN KINASE-like 2.2 n=1 Tax=Glycine soja TaxID=3848 RepID=A0A445GUJ2_GLYSO|nr:LEAF RUST 10 DISEASE-RESISTANCE LOCUS RECEPTOR-LIKE PROTEIN KINASE-like 2.2 [Glycine soja]